MTIRSLLIPFSYIFYFLTYWWKPLYYNKSLLLGQLDPVSVFLFSHSHIAISKQAAQTRCIAQWEALLCRWGWCTQFHQSLGKLLILKHQTEMQVLLLKQENDTFPGLRDEKSKQNWNWHHRFSLPNQKCKQVYFLGYVLQVFCQEVSHPERRQHMVMGGVEGILRWWLCYFSLLLSSSCFRQAWIPASLLYENWWEGL